MITFERSPGEYKHWEIDINSKKAFLWNKTSWKASDKLVWKKQFRKESSIGGLYYQVNSF